MTSLCCDVLDALRGKTLVTAESLTGGGIGSALTAIPGSSEIYKGGIISYIDGVKQEILGVSSETLDAFGAVSEPVAKAMAAGARRLLKADAAVAVTGLAGPGGDDYGNPVGTVFIAYEDAKTADARRFLFCGNREDIRKQTIRMALTMILEHNKRSC